MPAVRADTRIRASSERNRPGFTSTGHDSANSSSHNPVTFGLANTNPSGFIWVPQTVAALQRDLCMTFLGDSLDTADRNFIIQDIPADSVDQYPNLGMGCIEIIGMIDRSMPNDSKVACLSFKAPG